MANAGGYSNASAFQFTVAAGVLIWLYSGALLVLRLTSGSGQPPTANLKPMSSLATGLRSSAPTAVSRTKASLTGRAHPRGAPVLLCMLA